MVDGVELWGNPQILLRDISRTCGDFGVVLCPYCGGESSHIDSFLQTVIDGKTRLELNFWCEQGSGEGAKKAENSHRFQITFQYHEKGTYATTNTLPPGRIKTLPKKENPSESRNESY